MPLKHNFSLASSRDRIVHGATRPGYAKDNEVAGGVADQDVEAWCSFMKEQGVTRILSLLGDDEVIWYKGDIADLLKKNGFDTDTRYTRVSVFTAGALDRIRNALREADESGEKIVVHCSGGGGRAALGLGVWLCDKYGVSPEEAAKEIKTYAESAGANRRPDATKLARLLANGTLGS